MSVAAFSKESSVADQCADENGDKEGSSPPAGEGEDERGCCMKGLLTMVLLSVLLLPGLALADSNFR